MSTVTDIFIRSYKPYICQVVINVARNNCKCICMSTWFVASTLLALYVAKSQCHRCKNVSLSNYYTCVPAAALRLYNIYVSLQCISHFSSFLAPLSSVTPPVSVCFAVCVLSLAWALVLYARACSLIRPGHLQMTPAAILCRLLWRVGMF